MESRFQPDTWAFPVALDKGAKADPLSPLAVAVVHSEIWLFWFSKERLLQYAATTFSDTGSTWSSGKYSVCLCLAFTLPPLYHLNNQHTNSHSWKITVQTIPLPSIPSILPRALAVARSTDPDLTQLFYLDNSTVRGIHYLSNQWGSISSTSSLPESQLENGPLAAVGLEGGETRLYMVAGAAEGYVVELVAEAGDGGWRWGSMPGLNYGRAAT
jgi:hypothetical protein